MNTKKNLLSVGLLVIVFFAGVAAMRVWDVYHAGLQRAENYSVPVHATDSLLTIDMESSAMPEGISEVEKPDYVESSVPSQLTPIDMEGIDKIISRTGRVITPPENEQEPSVVDLTGMSALADEPAQPELKSHISMIHAPVEVKLIKTADEYKAFKRVARGSYPAADFSKQDVLVLESSSSLPDKVFEIQTVREEDGKLVVTYRVNVFGLDKKTNTHSAVLIQKHDLPVELKQVL